MSLRKVVLRAKASVVEAPVIDEQITASFAKASGNEGVNQEDLLHVRSTLVTSGANRNKDFFKKAELWAARKTPQHKPSDWDHDRTKIMGHIYRVEARTISGETLDLDAESPSLMDGTPYDGDFELIVDKVVYAALLPEYAKKIKELSAQGNLHVSMEAWFNDYDFVTWEDDSELSEARLADEVEFEFHARSEHAEWEDLLITSSAGGNGKLEDGRSVGRALKDIIFGGIGYVGVPGNPRSEIHSVSDRSPASVVLAKLDDGTFEGKEKSDAAEKGEGWTHKYTVNFSIFGGEHMSDVNVTGEVVAKGGLEAAMSAFKTNIFPRLTQLASMVIAELDLDVKLNPTPWYKTINAVEDEGKIMYSCSFEFEREPEPEEEEQEPQSILAESVTADLVSGNVQEVNMGADLQELQAQLKELKSENARLKEEQTNAASAAEDAGRMEKVDALLKTVATPAEIARIDAAIEAGQDPWAAKLAFLEESRKQAGTAVAHLEQEVEKFRLRDRVELVKALNLYTDEKLEKVRDQIAKMEDEAFAEWLEERKDFADKIAAASATEAEAEEETEEEATEEPAQSATAALEDAEPEEKPNFADTKSESEDAPAEADGEEKTYDELALMVSNPPSTRLTRLRKERGDHFGR
jgi:hypothetical protein